MPPSVCEYLDERIEGLRRIFSVIKRDSAIDLLQAAISFEMWRDLEAWAACPIRDCPARAAARWIHSDDEGAIRQLVAGLVKRERVSADEAETVLMRRKAYLLSHGA